VCDYVKKNIKEGGGTRLQIKPIINLDISVKFYYNIISKIIKKRDTQQQKEVYR